VLVETDDGASLQVRSVGHVRAGRVPMLFTHGFGSSSEAWLGTAADLAADRVVVTWDIRGHGRTRAPREEASYTRERAVADMVTVMDATDLGRCVLGGLSLGGYLSLACCGQHPDRVAGLVLCDTGPGYRDVAARARWNEFARAQAEAIERDGIGGLGQGIETGVHHEDPAGLAMAARGLLTQHDAAVIEHLGEVDVPTLVVVGEHDTPFLDAARYIARKVPAATLEVIAGAGHASNLDQPAAFSEIVRGFLATRVDEGPDASA